MLRDTQSVKVFTKIIACAVALLLTSLVGFYTKSGETAVLALIEDTQGKPNHFGDGVTIARANEGKKERTKQLDENISLAGRWKGSDDWAALAAAAKLDKGKLNVFDESAGLAATKDNKQEKNKQLAERVALATSRESKEDKPNFLHAPVVSATASEDKDSPKYLEHPLHEDLFAVNGSTYSQKYRDRAPNCENNGCHPRANLSSLAALCSSDRLCSGFSYNVDGGCLKRCHCQEELGGYVTGARYFVKHPDSNFESNPLEAQAVPGSVLNTPEFLKHHALANCFNLGQGPPRERPRDGSCGSPCVAHCIVGHPRDGLRREVFHSLRHYLVDAFSDDPHVFLYLKMNGMHTKHDFAAVAMERVWPMAAYLNVSRSMLVYENCTTGFCVSRKFALVCNYTGQQVELSHCRPQWRGFGSCMDMVRDYEAANSIEFAWVTKTRPDASWTLPVVHVSLLDKASVWVSQIFRCGYGGIDWFVAIPRRFVDTVSTYSEKVSCTRVCHLPLNSSSGCFGCECLLAGHLLAENITFRTLPWGGVMPHVYCGERCDMPMAPNRSSIPCIFKGVNGYWCTEGDAIPERTYTGNETV